MYLGVTNCRVALETPKIDQSCNKGPKKVPSATIIVSRIVEVLKGSCNRLLIVYFVFSALYLLPCTSGFVNKIRRKPNFALLSQFHSRGKGGWIFACGTRFGLESRLNKHLVESKIPYFLTRRACQTISTCRFMVKLEKKSKQGGREVNPTQPNSQPLLIV